VNRKVGAQQKPESQHGSRRERQQNHTLGATRALEIRVLVKTEPRRSDLARCTREQRDRREQEKQRRESKTPATAAILAQRENRHRAAVAAEGKRAESRAETPDEKSRAENRAHHENGEREPEDRPAAKKPSTK
jgi:hypothetical protein